MAAKVNGSVAPASLAGDIIGLIQYVSYAVQALNTILVRLYARLNAVLPEDGSEPMLGPLSLATYTTSTLPTASSTPGAVIYVSNGAAGAKFRGSDGSTWVNLG